MENIGHTHFSQKKGCIHPFFATENPLVPLVALLTCNERVNKIKHLTREPLFTFISPSIDPRHIYLPLTY